MAPEFMLSELPLKVGIEKAPGNIQMQLINKSELMMVVSSNTPANLHDS
jgi:hypothetical protein